MNPTRALIEAIEAYTKGTDSSLPFKQRLATAREQWRTLQAAISSAKAAEEGVETRYEIQQVWKDDHVNHVCYALDKSDGLRKLPMMPFAARLLRYELVKKEIRTTVIEVREKEGIDGQ